jgi:anti-anti-sigma factor
MPSTIIESVVGRRSVLHLIGEIDIADRAALVDACARVRGRDARTRAVIDLTRVEFIDCAGLRELARTVRARQVLGDPGVTVVRSPFLRRLLDITGYAAGTTVVPDLAAALDIVSQGWSAEGGRCAAG